MEHQEIVSRFLAFCGLDRFRKFVLQLNQECRVKGRLLFWQEEFWARFASTQQGEVPLDFKGVSEALRLCPIHELPLKSGRCPSSTDWSTSPRNTSRPAMSGSLSPTRWPTAAAASARRRERRCSSAKLAGRSSRAGVSGQGKEAEEQVEP